MTAATSDRNTPARESKKFEFPMAAATKGLAGTIACLNASGYLVPGSTSTTLKAVGIFDAVADNSSGAAGDIRGKVRRGCFKFVNYASDAITLANVGSSCYIVDNQTVAATSGSSTRSVAGTVRDIESDGVWVEF